MSRSNELSSCIERALAQYFADLDGEAATGVYAMVIHEVERPLLEAVLKRTRGNQTQAADMLGINRNTLRKKLADHGIN